MSPSRCLIRTLITALALVSLLGCSGKEEGASCRLSNPPPGDPNNIGDCASDLICDISEACQEATASCTGVCRKDCTQNPSMCTGGRTCTTTSSDYPGEFCHFPDGGGCRPVESRLSPRRPNAPRQAHLHVPARPVEELRMSPDPTKRKRGKAVQVALGRPVGRSCQIRLRGPALPSPCYARGAARAARRQPRRHDTHPTIQLSGPSVHADA